MKTYFYLFFLLFLLLVLSPFDSNSFYMRKESIRYVSSPFSFNDEFFSFVSIIPNVPLIDQRKEFPNGCEAVSAVMLLQFFGYSISPAEFIDTYLSKGNTKMILGTRYGPDPQIAYVGDPRSKKDGFGCFSPVVEKAMRKVVSFSHEIVNLTGKEFSFLEKMFLSRDIPVMIWATVEMKPITKFCQWKSFDSNEIYLYPSVQHALVLIGRDHNFLYFNDPLHDEIVFYDYDLVVERYDAMGRQAIAVVPTDLLFSMTK